VAGQDGRALRIYGARLVDFSKERNAKTVLQRQEGKLGPLFSGAGIFVCRCRGRERGGTEREERIGGEG